MNIKQHHEPLDGLTLTHLPDGLGRPSDFAFEWGDVAFVQRVWESQVEPKVWRVDLQVQVMRGERLADVDALRAFLIEYHERDADWAADPFGDAGFATQREVAVFVEPGLAFEVRDPFGRTGFDQAKAIAEGVGTGEG